MPENFSFNLISYYKILKNKGFKSVIDEIKDNLLFDIINGTSTQLREGKSNLEFKHYSPGYTSLVHDSLKILPIYFKKSTFVDFGSGKGKITLIATKYNFKNIVGVEIKNNLVDIAKKNELIFFSKYWNKKFKKNISFINCDAINYVFKGDENVFFMFDPFPKEKLKKIINNISKNKQTHLRQIYIIFFNPPKYLTKIVNKLKLEKIIFRNTYSSFVYKLL